MAWKKSSLELFYGVTSLPLCILQGERYLLRLPEADQVPLSSPLAAHYLQLFRDMGGDGEHPRILPVESLAMIAIVQLAPGEFAVLGPAATHALRSDEIRSALSSPLYDGNRDYLCDLLFTAPILNSAAFVADLRLALDLLDLPVPSAAELFDAILPPHTDPDIGRTIYYTQEQLVLHTPYALEERISRAIEEGDSASLRSFSMETVSDHLGILSFDSLRQARYMFVTAAAVASRAAIRGGLDAEIAYSTADLYCQEMDRCSHIPQIEAMMPRMMLDFCEKVASSRSLLTYSPVIRQCCETVHRSSHGKVSLEQLSRDCGLSPSRLSERFHRETGFSLVEYTHRVRMTEAEYLLRRTSRTISEISHILGFSSQSYFTVLFRRYYGMTPAAFRSGTQKA